MECYMCGAEMEYMGTLGDLAWFRCPDCGMEMSSPVDMTDEEDEDE